MPLEHLFDAELTYRAGMAPLAEHGEGQLIGSYAWLDGALGVWEGEFDAQQHSARYRAFVQAPAGQMSGD